MQGSVPGFIVWGRSPEWPWHWPRRVWITVLRYSSLYTVMITISLFLFFFCGGGGEVVRRGRSSQEDSQPCQTRDEAKSQDVLWSYNDNTKYSILFYYLVPLTEFLFSELLLMVPLKYWLLVFLKTGSVLLALPEKELSCLACRGVEVDWKSRGGGACCWLDTLRVGSSSSKSSE